MNCKIGTIILFFISLNIFAQSPHGKDFNINCGVCHNSASWTVNVETDSFNHNKTEFPLVGQHKMVDCRSCHATLRFSEAKPNCVSCHYDIHQQTLGNNCEQCHTPTSWLVSNIKAIHQQRGFVLVGAHASADCRSCHTSASEFRYNILNADCYSCHKKNYLATTKPNHQSTGYSTDCYVCHNMVGNNWTASGKGFEHGFFPLNSSHNLECSKCHTSQNVKQKLDPRCQTCHISEYTKAKASHPAHATIIAKYECVECHSLQNWNLVRFKQHDSWFRIYSGDHKGEWDKCNDCHNNDATYKANCSRCHSNQ